MTSTSGEATRTIRVLSETSGKEMEFALPSTTAPPTVMPPSAPKPIRVSHTTLSDQIQNCKTVDEIRNTIQEGSTSKRSARPTTFDILRESSSNHATAAMDVVRPPNSPTVHRPHHSMIHRESSHGTPIPDGPKPIEIVDINRDRIGEAKTIEDLRKLMKEGMVLRVKPPARPAREIAAPPRATKQPTKDAISSCHTIQELHDLIVKRDEEKTDDPSAFEKKSMKRCFSRTKIPGSQVTGQVRTKSTKSTFSRTKIPGAQVVTSSLKTPRTTGRAFGRSKGVE